MPKRMNGGARPERWERLAAEFLDEIWSVHDHGYVIAATREPYSNKWRDFAFELEDGLYENLLTHFGRYSREHFDHYFCPNAFSHPARRAKAAYATPWCQVDIDEADVSAFDPQPNIIIRTSPGRHQGLWLSKRTLPAHIAARHSKDLAYRYGADKTGWSSTKVLRVPHTINHKRQYKRPVVRVLKSDFTPQVLPPLRKEPSKPEIVMPIAVIRVDALHDWRDVYQRYRKQLHPRARALITSKRAYAFEHDRSKCIYEIIADLIRVGADFGEIASVLLHNPYFISKHGKDIDKAEAEIVRVTSKLGGVR